MYLYVYFAHKTLWIQHFEVAFKIAEKFIFFFSFMLFFSSLVFFYNSAHVRLNDAKITHIFSVFLEAAKLFVRSFSIRIVVKIDIFFCLCCIFGGFSAAHQKLPNGFYWFTSVSLRLWIYVTAPCHHWRHMRFNVKWKTTGLLNNCMCGHFISNTQNQTQSFSLKFVCFFCAKFRCQCPWVCLQLLFFHRFILVDSAILSSSLSFFWNSILFCTQPN